MKLTLKDIEGKVTQRYSDKHYGVDIDNGHGSPVRSYFKEEYVYKVLTKENPSNDGTGFTGVFTIVEQDGFVFEFLYGHCNPTVQVGAILTKGTILGTQSNNGESYSKGERITLEMQRNGDTRGSHRHDQMRMLRKDTTIQPNTRYLDNYGGSFLQKDGFYFAVPNYGKNNGTVNWLDETPQKPTHITNFLKALDDFQKAEGIPPAPRIGPRTTAKLKQLGIM